MSKSEDPLARARRALSQVDTELDLDRARSTAHARARSGADAHLGTDDPSESGVEVLTHGQRPALPRHRAAAWALVATVALLGGAGISAAVLWQGPGETVPGAPAPILESDLPSDAPSPGPTVDPSGGCTPSPSTLDPVPTPEGSGQGSEFQPSERCGTVPSPSPSAGTNSP